MGSLHSALVPLPFNHVSRVVVTAMDTVISVNVKRRAMDASSVRLPLQTQPANVRNLEEHVMLLLLSVEMKTMSLARAQTPQWSPVHKDLVTVTGMEAVIATM